MAQVSVSSGGTVWMLAWNGRVLARRGVASGSETGAGWYEVPLPFTDAAFSHISVGADSAWAVARDGHVWMRKGSQPKPAQAKAFPISSLCEPSQSHADTVRASPNTNQRKPT